MVLNFNACGTQQPAPVQEPIQEYRQSGLPRRNTRLPQRYDDRPPPAPPVPVAPVDPPDLEEVPNSPLVEIPSLPPYKTDSNTFGVYRVYRSGIPDYSPDADFHLNKVADDPNFLGARPNIPLPMPGPFRDDTDLDNPYENKTVEKLMTWYYSGSNTKSLQDLNVLTHNVILADDFNRDDLKGFNASKAMKALDNEAGNPRLPLKDGWKRSSIPLSMPLSKKKYPSEAAAPVHFVEGLLHRKLTNVIVAAFQEKSANEFHLSPFEEYWKPSPDAPPERIYSELYNSNALLKEHEHIRRQSHSNCNLQIVVFPMMFWSDATHLTSFGNASLWPIYMFNGGQSKYTRAKPTSFAAHHIAYIPKVRF